MLQVRDWQRPLADRIRSSLEQRNFCVAACCTGSGKTYLALDAMSKLGGAWLVLAPKATLTQWHRTAAGFGIGDRVSCINPEQISKAGGCKWYDGTKWYLPLDTRGVVIDEFHKGCSGPDSKFTLAVARLKAYRQMGLFMSATPAVSPLQMRAVAWWGGLCGFDRSSFYGWTRRHGVSEVYIRDRKVLKFTTNPVRAKAFMLEIRKSLGDSFIALTPDQIPGFPTETADIVYLDPGAAGKEVIDAAYMQMSERLRAQARSDLAAVSRERERIEFVMAEPIARQVAEVSDETAVVVFWNFTEPRLRFEAELRRLTGEDIAVVCGGQNEDERQAMIDAFREDKIRVASIMAAAGGAGISMHNKPGGRPRESYIIPSYSAAELKQCFGRIRREGGDHVTQHLVIATGSVQERVVSSLERKLDNLDALCDADLAII